VTSGSGNGSSWRLRVYPLAILAALALALLLATLRFEPGDPSSRLGGDYPSFYGAGAIAADGDWGQLYDAARQQQEQAGLIDDEGGYLYFSYPPFVAAGYGLLARLDYRWSFLLHTILMTLALAGAITVLRPWLRWTGLPLPALLVVALAFYPVFTGVIGGQNVALSLLLFAGAARLDHDDRAYLAGVVAALLLYKPQFGVVVVPLLLVARRWRMLAGWATGAIALLAISTMLMGGSWLSDWWGQAADFSSLNVAANGLNFISFPGFLVNALGAGSHVAQAAGYGLGVLAAVAVAREW
jgi:alpha-1,2-mannosyltransferase